MFCKRLLPVLFALLVSVGCAQVQGPVRTYDGPPRPEAEVARIVAPEALEVLKVDGRSVKLPYVPGGHYEVHLLPGPHRISVAYREMWGDATSSMVVVSDALIFDLEARAGQRYRLEYPAPANVTDAQLFAGTPRIWLVDVASGSRLEPVDVTAHGNLLSRAARRMAGADATAPPPAPGNPAGDAAEQDPLAQLKRWWQRAEPADRAAFRAWLEYQD